MKGKDSENQILELRRRAEEAAEKSRGVFDVSALSPEDVQRLVHELQVHQIELEMQNEELRQSQVKLEELKVRYQNLYDFAPVGYVMLNDRGLILDANFTTARLLGVDRQRLTKMFFSAFVGQEFGDAFHLYLQHLFETQSKQTCQINLTSEGGSQFYAQLESVAVRDESGQFSRCMTVLSDITERKRVQEELRESEERFRSAFEQAAVGMAHNSTDGRFLRVNRKFADILGYENEAILDLRFQDISHPDDLEGSLNLVRQLVDGEITRFSQEKRYIRHDGSAVWCNTTVSLNRPTAGEPEYLMAIIEDISRRKEAEESLARSERFLTNVFGSIPDGISVLDKDMNIVMVNQAMERWFAHAMPFTGRKCFDVYHGASRPCDICPTVQTLKTGKPAVEVVPMTGKDGIRVGWNELYSFPLTEMVTGELTGVVEFVRDITASKSAEDALQEAERRYRTLAESLPQLVWTTRADGPCDYLSPQWVAYTGISEDEQLGYGWSKQIHPEDWPGVQTAWTESVKIGAPFNIEFRIRRADGMYRWFKTKAAPLRNEAGEIVKWIGMNLDIEELKQVEGNLQATLGDLEAVNRELEHFAYVASHDLREPLRKISNFTELLANRYKGKLDEKADKYIWYVVDGAQRMERLIDDLLAYSRAGRTELQLEPTSVEHELKTTLADLETLVRESGAEVTSSHLPVVKADPTQLRRVLQNLIANAVKFRGEEAPRIHLSAEKQGKEWVFSLRDNGIGFDPEQSERIFTLFQRLHARTEYPGTGIGLAVCRKIVERHGGRIWAESEPGRGSTFYFTLPVMT